ncbi:MAG TPA: tripartite tricarboxylate transporter permease [Trueperaceae bacterium]|nr:tripartite tricarboxylate transporter permease [Trueperaceae bacterium]HRP45952.1 tripartite tricarboxylate transporter permease [Trueperaceae bacterium]
MGEGLGYLFQAVLSFLTLSALFNIAWATLLGIVVGMLPGLTATLGVALLTTLTFTMPSGDAILVLICMYVGAIYGGSRSAILLNIPGTPANAATSLDGNPLARQGKAGKAMGIATAGSFLGSIIGMVLLASIAPGLAEAALKFQSYEFFWLAIFGIVIAGRLTALEDPLKGWIAGFLGLLVAMVGAEGIYSYARFSYGNTDFSGGLGLLPVLVGMFGFTEILFVMYQPAATAVSGALDSVIPKVREVVKYWQTIIRSGVIGTLMGLIPGVGEDMGAWVSYAAARGSSKEKHLFGKGSVEGLIAAETGNNAAVPGALIPVLTLAVPGSAPAAVLLAALFIHGVRPGPLIMIESPSFVYEVTAMVFMATLSMGFFGILLTKPLLTVLRIPPTRLMPIIMVLCTVGSFAIASRMFDVWVMLAFGIIGFVLRRAGFPLAPLILGVVLGPILDSNLRRGLLLSDGSITPFIMRPISAALWIAILITVLLGVPAVQRALGRLFKGRKAMSKSSSDA